MVIPSGYKQCKRCKTQFKKWSSRDTASYCPSCNTSRLKRQETKARIKFYYGSKEKDEELKKKRERKAAENKKYWEEQEKRKDPDYLLLKEKKKKLHPLWGFKKPRTFEDAKNKTPYINRKGKWVKHSKRDIPKTTGSVKMSKIKRRSKFKPKVLNVKIPKWTPFVEVKELVEQYEKVLDSVIEKLTEEQVANFRKKIPESVWSNSRYLVQVYDASCQLNVPMKHLSIKNHQNNHFAHDWRDLQRIKNEICGDEKEALEVYPAMSRLVDNSNQFHLWVFMEEAPFKIGWKHGGVSPTQEIANINSKLFGIGEVKQRNMEEGFISDELLLELEDKKMESLK